MRFNFLKALCSLSLGVFHPDSGSSIFRCVCPEILGSRTPLIISSFIARLSVERCKSCMKQRRLGTTIYGLSIDGISIIRLKPKQHTSIGAINAVRAKYVVTHQCNLSPRVRVFLEFLNSYCSQFLGEMEKNLKKMA